MDSCSWHKRPGGNTRRRGDFSGVSLPETGGVVVANGRLFVTTP